LRHLAITVRVVLAEELPEMALIVAVPAAIPVATPPLVMVATVVSDELQVAVEVTSWVVPSDNVPVALKA